ncbi:MAG TPA: PilZ domain-containing protein [Candidatus Omnitrophota bacterium]|nr:PilZ domain-containing protein [Candidatus Omnitrophota bacterium]HPT38951.1 PilZ domain-containing protein [Candidatus Omnitrophota bacterium]
MDERRIKPRWQINQGAELTFENGVHAIPCVVEDISQSGMRVALRRNLFDDVFSNFKLAFTNDFELNLGAQVVWREEKFEKNIYGLVFNRIDKMALEGLDQYIENNFHDLVVKHWWEGRWQ